MKVPLHCASNQPTEENCRSRINWQKLGAFLLHLHVPITTNIYKTLLYKTNCYFATDMERFDSQLSEPCFRRKHGKIIPILLNIL